MPNGYARAMRIFTKLTKVPFFYLRKKGHPSVVYVDDSYLQGSTKEKCLENVHDTIVLLQSLGFTIHPDKSIFEPAQKITFLGFIIDLITVTITLTAEKKEKISNICQELIEAKKPTIRNLAKAIGNLVASFPAVKYEKLHYRNLENEKLHH